MIESTLPLGTLGALLFTLMGPVAAMPLFVKVTTGVDGGLRRRIALRAMFVALAALAIAVFIGAGVLSGWGVSPPSLIIAAGLILLFSALRNVLGAGSSASGDVNPPAGMAAAITPLAIPGLVTPMGVAVLVIFVSYFPAMSDKLAIMAVATAIMALNLAAMLVAHRVMRSVGASPLLVLGAVFGVLQAAMGVEMIVSGVKRSGLIG